MSIVSYVQQLDPLTPTTATVQVTFKVDGDLPQVVQIYAYNLGGWVDLATLMDTVDIEAKKTEYVRTIQLRAGAFYTISVCPRSLGPNGVLSDYFDGAYWETSCAISTLTTKALEVAHPDSRVTPTITSIEPSQATLTKESAIVVRWTGPTKFGQFHFMWKEQAETWSSHELNYVPPVSDGNFTLSKAVPGRTYSFKVQGCEVEQVLPNICTAFTSPVNFVMPGNTHSLREFLRLSNVQLTPGIRSLGQAAFSNGIRALMKL